MRATPATHLHEAWPKLKNYTLPVEEPQTASDIIGQWFISALTWLLDNVTQKRASPNLPISYPDYSGDDFVEEGPADRSGVVGSPSFDRLIDKVMDRFKMGKAKAMAVVVFSVNVVGTFALMFGGIALASLLSGVPVWAK